MDHNTLLLIAGSILVFFAIITGIAFLLLITSATDDPDPQYSAWDIQDGHRNSSESELTHRN